MMNVIFMHIEIASLKLISKNEIAVTESLDVYSVIGPLCDTGFWEAKRSESSDTWTSS